MPPKRILLVALTAALAPGCDGTIMGVAPPDLEPPKGEEEPVDPTSFECARLDAHYASQTPTVLMVLDRSWSMTWDFGETSRWAAMGETLVGGDGLVTRLQDQVRFGAAFYTTDFDAGVCPKIDSSPPKLNNADELRDLYQALAPLQHTPTGEALEQATELIALVADPGPKVMVLATDGLPDTCAVPHPNSTPEALDRVVSAATNAYDQGIATIVVSVGDGLTEEHLQDVANAGAGRGQDGTDDAEYFVALSPDELVESMDSIIHGLRACVFDVDTAMGLDVGEEGPRLIGGEVTLDGEPLQAGTDWRIRGPRTIEILGDACELLKSGDHELSGTLDCTATIL